MKPAMSGQCGSIIQYLAKTLTPNMKIVLSGKVKLFNGRFVFESPEWEPLEEGDLIHTGRLVPVYPLTEGLHQRQTRKMIKGIVDLWADRVPDFLPSDIKDPLPVDSAAAGNCSGALS